MKLPARNISGYTLIEILMVIFISSLVVLLSLAGYRSFNDRQVLAQNADDIVSVLRDAQNRAISGEKAISDVCAGHTSPCTFNGWRFEWGIGAGQKEYKITCEYYDSSAPPVSFTVSECDKSFKLPVVNNLRFEKLNIMGSSSPSNGIINFLPVGIGVSFPGDDYICIRGNNGLPHKISVNSGGQITVQNDLGFCDN